MKTKIFLILLILSSCDLNTDKTEILTSEEWILEYRYEKLGSNGVAPADEVYFKKSTKYMFWKFESNTVQITHQGGKTVETSLWSWKDDRKEQIIISQGKYKGEYHVGELTDENLWLSKWNISKGDQLMLKFRTNSSDGWASDEQVVSINKMLRSEK